MTPPDDTINPINARNNSGCENIINYFWNLIVAQMVEITDALINLALHKNGDL
jgi:hypothetical protein